MPLSHLKIPVISSRPHTFTDELLAKAVKGIWLSNILLMYLAGFFTVKLLGVGQ